MLGAPEKQYVKRNPFHPAGRLGTLAGLLLLSGILYSQEISSVATLPFSSLSSDLTGVVTLIGAVTEDGEPVIAGTLNFREGDKLLGSVELMAPSGKPVADDSQLILLALADPNGENVPDFVLGAGTGISLWPGIPKTPSSGPVTSPSSPTGRQTKRILGIMPNFEAVSANVHLPPLSLKEKFWLATENTFDYSSLISVGMQAAIEQARNTYPEFHGGAAAYGRYYWHTLADSGVENYLVQAIIPAITHEDPRYYTLDRGPVLERVRYAISRLWITRSDAKTSTFNFSEIVGSGVAAEVSSRYYPREARSSGQTLERWASQLINDGVGNVIQEFWPDIHQKLFKQH